MRTGGTSSAVFLLLLCAVSAVPDLPDLRVVPEPFCDAFPAILDPPAPEAAGTEHLRVMALMQDWWGRRFAPLGRDLVRVLGQTYPDPLQQPGSGVALSVGAGALGASGPAVSQEAWVTTVQRLLDPGGSGVDDAGMQRDGQYTRAGKQTWVEKMGEAAFLSLPAYSLLRMWVTRQPESLESSVAKAQIRRLQAGGDWDRAVDRAGVDPLLREQLVMEATEAAGDHLDLLRSERITLLVSAWTASQIRLLEVLEVAQKTLPTQIPGGAR